jgi:hypothetical protein
MDQQVSSPTRKPRLAVGSFLDDSPQILNQFPDFMPINRDVVTALLSSLQLVSITINLHYFKL